MSPSFLSDPPRHNDGHLSLANSIPRGVGVEAAEDGVTPLRRPPVMGSTRRRRGRRISALEQEVQRRKYDTHGRCRANQSTDYQHDEDRRAYGEGVPR